MSEQMMFPQGGNALKAGTALEKAREAHQRYLICGRSSDLQEAIEYYVDAVKLDPTIPESYYRLASLMWEQGQISVDTAIEQCKTACSLAPANMNAHMYTGFFMKLARDYKSAEKEFKSAVKMGRLNSARPRLVLSQSILQRINRKNGSLSDYVRFLYYFISGILMLTWDKPALTMFRRSISNEFAVFKYNAIGRFLERFRMFAFAENLYKKAVDRTEHGEIFYRRMGDMALKNKDFYTAADSYRRALEANPLSRDVLAKLAILLQIYFPDKIDETIDCWEKLLEFDLEKAPIYYELGHLYLEKDDKINSISAFKLAVDEAPDDPFYNNSLAFAYSKAGLYEDAINHYQRAIDLNPDKKWTSVVCQVLGALYAEVNGNFEAAIAAYQAGLILNPKNYTLHLALGDIYMAEYDLDKAIKNYCDAIAIDPIDYRGYSKVGIALWEKDCPEEALVAYHKAVELNPDNEFAHNNLGTLYLDGFLDAKKSMEYFEKAIKINPSYTLAYFNAGRALQAMELTNDAMKYYQMAMDLNKLTGVLDEDDILSRIHELFEL